MKDVMFNYVVDGVVVDGPMPYQTVLARTGLKDTVGFTEAGYMEYFPPEPEIIITPEQVARGIRAMRSYFLKSSDWTQLADNQLSVEKKAEWAVYRQALRDLPETMSSVTDPRDAVFPQAPN